MISNAALYEASVWVIPAIMAITLHEAAHGFVAYQFGDDTAYKAGRVTANPFRHIDLVGTILLPAMLLLARSPFLFGYAKPVPVNYWHLRNPRRDMVWVAAAGPASNILQATVVGALVHLIPFAPVTWQGWIGDNFANAILLNLLLAVFNMIPLPPLDGGRVAVGLLPRPLAMPLARLERYGLFILIALALVLPYATAGRFNILADVIVPPAIFLYRVIMFVTGNGLVPVSGIES
ncbi:MAG TPA: site-2 protease family protein [Stellaceae bacterium]|nr:site-2 protease family protein [Stellaceae bacterium]